MKKETTPSAILGKSDLSVLVADKLQQMTDSKITEKEMLKVMDAFSAVIKEQVGKGNSIRLIGFGTFEKKVTAPRKGRNPQTGEAIDIPAHQRLAFHSKVQF